MKLTKLQKKSLQALKKAIAYFGSQNALAAALKEQGYLINQSYVNFWLHKSKVAIPCKWAIPIEEVTDGLVTRYMSRPDLYPMTIRKKQK